MASDPPSQINPSSHPTFASIASLPSSMSTSYRLIVLNIPISVKLSRCNFFTGRCQIEPALHDHGLYKFLTNASPPKNLSTDGVHSSNPVYYHWYQQDQLILTWLRSSLTETILNQTVSCTTSAQLWSLLRQSFSATSWARLTELRRALQTTTKGRSSYLEFCQQMRAIADELAFIGYHISDDDLVIQILTGLGSDFNVVVDAANAKEHLEFAELQAMLLSHEALLFSQLGGGSTSFFADSAPAALYIQSKSGPCGSRSGKGNRTRGGHTAAYQPQTRPPILPTPTFMSQFSARPNSNAITRPSRNRVAQALIQIEMLCAKSAPKEAIMLEFVGIELILSHIMIRFSRPFKPISPKPAFKLTMLKLRPSPMAPSGIWTRVPLTM